MHNFQEQCQVTGDVVWMVESLLVHYAFVLIFFKTMYNKLKQLLDSVFVISRIIKVSVSVISRSQRLDYSGYYKKTSFSNCLESITASGAGGDEVITGSHLLSSNFHPKLSGDGIWG